MLLFRAEGPTEEQRAAGYEADPDLGKRKPCNTFWWTGQDLRWCENCGRPCWEHLYAPGFGKNAGLRRKQSRARARAMWEKWGKPHGIEFRPPHDPDEPPYPTVISGPEQLARASAAPLPEQSHPLPAEEPTSE